ncbi:hypothetical protein [Polaromonas sp. YR568]|uniref:hypothetical protein n=1 Tax=Polaromonas sp. YR568 TaxID=1855301 RepID=UPI000B87B318|nr:hypothetical protein [Polaromonas sp. YR568]
MNNKVINKLSIENRFIVNAEQVRRIACGQLGWVVEYDDAGVRWLNKYINTLRGIASEESKEKLTDSLGAFLGECICRTFNGQWVEYPKGEWMVRVDPGVSVYPFRKARKQLAGEETNSVADLFDAIPAMRTKLTASQNADDETRGKARSQPWWKFW